MRHALFSLLGVCCLSLCGCAVLELALGVEGVPLESSPPMHELARLAYGSAVKTEKNRCENGHYTGADVQTLLNNGKKWGTADSKFGPWKVYTFIYYNSQLRFDGFTDWYEYWYQLYDYDLDGKIDECKYHEIFKGTTGQSPEYKRGEEDMKQFMKEADERRRQGVYYRSHPDAL